MHIEFLLEDLSSKVAMDILIPKIVGREVTYRVIDYLGGGKLPKNLRPKTDASKRILLDRLPKLLRGYGHVPGSIVVVICDLDDRDKHIFLSELNNVLDNCNPKPIAFFCIAIEEFEAWYLGDIEAVIKAYPSADRGILRKYNNDSICGTWECLADAVYKGGHLDLKKKGWQSVGMQKSMWARDISPHMDIENNSSPSFRHMRAQLQRAITTGKER